MCNIGTRSTPYDSAHMTRSVGPWEAEIVEVLLSWDEPISAMGAAKQAGAGVWHGIAPRKLLAAARQHAERHGEPAAFLAVYHALLNRNEKLRGAPHFLKGEQCDIYVQYYKQLTSESN